MSLKLFIMVQLLLFLVHPPLALALALTLTLLISIILKILRNWLHFPLPLIHLLLDLFTQPHFCWHYLKLGC